MAVASNPLESFIWGAGGQKMSPEQVARQREMAAALMQGGMDYSPVNHWLQGAARASQGLVGGLKDRWAGEAEHAGKHGFQSQWDSVFGGGGGSPVAAALAGGGNPALSAIEGVAPTGGARASVPTGDNAAYIRQGLTSRGLPDHVADAFLLNFQDESGLNPGINEAKPTVPGSRGGYGLYQLTGPRRRAYEAFAAERGIPVDSIDGQLDFLMGELAGSESAAAKKILSASDTPSAAAAIVNSFLRPAEEHRAQREAAYLGGRTNLPQASGSPTAMPQGAVPAMNAAPQGVGNPSVAQLLALSGNEWANPGQSNVINALLNQGLQQQDPAYQQQMAMRDIQMQQEQLKLQQMLNPAAPFQPTMLTPEQMAQFGIPEGSGSWITSESGVPQQLYTPPEPTSGIQNFGFLTGQGFDPQDAATRAFSGGVTVNTGDQGPKVGSIPPSMALVPDETNPTGFRMEVIPGSPEAQAQAAAATASEIGAQNTGRTANIVREDIGRIRDIVGNSNWFNPAVGFGADVASAISGSNASNVAALSKTVLANIGFDRLQQMRDASPTGGALGAISDRELGTLQSVMGNLEQSQSVDQFIYNLDRLGSVYDELLSKAAAYPNARQFGIQAPASSQEQQQPSAPPNQSQPPRLTTRAEFDAAPSGTVFTAPDGTIRVKP